MLSQLIRGDHETLNRLVRDECVDQNFRYSCTQIEFPTAEYGKRAQTRPTKTPVSISDSLPIGQNVTRNKEFPWTSAAKTRLFERRKVKSCYEPNEHGPLNAPELGTPYWWLPPSPYMKDSGARKTYCKARLESIARANGATPHQPAKPFKPMPELPP